MTDIKTEAEGMVEKFTDIEGRYLGDATDWLQAKQCAIIHCEGVIEALTKVLKTGLNNDFDVMKERGHYQNLIEYIQKM